MRKSIKWVLLAALVATAQYKATSAPAATASPSTAPSSAAARERKALEAELNARSCSPKTGMCWPKLQRGARNEDVRALQYLLRYRGQKLGVDGVFGAATETALRDFQRRQRLQVDGVVGWQSWEALAPTLKRGAKGDAVRALQTLLVGPRFHLKTRDGVFGAATEKAVRAVQNTVPWKEKKQPSGVANTDVWCIAAGGWFDGE